MMTYLSLLLALTGTFGFFCYTRQIPKSVSAMVYGFPRRLQWLWSAWLVAVGFLLLIPMWERLNDRLACFAFLTFMFLTGAAVTPLVNRETSLWHDWMGVSAGLMSQCVVAVINPVYLLSWALYLAVLPFPYMRSRLVLVSEVCCAASLYGVLVIGN